MSTTSVPVDRRMPERRRSARSAFASLAALMGPRLRMQSAFHLRTGLAAIDGGAGSVLVITIPPSRSRPIEVHAYPTGVTVALTEHIAVHE